MTIAHPHLNIYTIINICSVFLCVAYFKGTSDIGPPKKKKKCKKKHFKERGADEKTPTPKSQQKPSASTQKAPQGPAKLNGHKTQRINASTPQAPKGKISTPRWSNGVLAMFPPARGLHSFFVFSLY